MPLTTLRTGIDPVRFFPPNWLAVTQIRCNSSGLGYSIAYVPTAVHTAALTAPITFEQLEDASLPDSWIETFLSA